MDFMTKLGLSAWSKVSPLRSERRHRQLTHHSSACGANVSWRRSCASAWTDFLLGKKDSQSRRPRFWSSNTKLVPMVGYPAELISCFGVNIRTRAAQVGLAEGTRKPSRLGSSLANLLHDRVINLQGISKHCQSISFQSFDSEDVHNSMVQQGIAFS